MDEAVALLNTHVASYYAKISEGKLTMRFYPGADFQLEGDGSPSGLDEQHMRAAGLQDCRGEAATSQQCSYGALGGPNRLLLINVTSHTGGTTYDGAADFGLVSLRTAKLGTLVHEIGHGWMAWPHSFAEVRWKPDALGSDTEVPNPYSNFVDFMPALALQSVLGWSQNLPSTPAIDRYAAGWIAPPELALHLSESGA